MEPVWHIDHSEATGGRFFLTQATDFCKLDATKKFPFCASCHSARPEFPDKSLHSSRADHELFIN